MFFASAVVGNAAGAYAATFNTASGDTTLKVSNYTDYPGSSSHWGSSVSADDGETLSFLISYHNTSSDKACDVRVRLNLPSSISNGQTISATVWADDTTPVTGTVTVYTSFSGSRSVSQVTGTDSVRWFAGPSSTKMTLPFSQSGTELTSSGGLRIGNIYADNSGYIIARARISGTAHVGDEPTAETQYVSGITDSSATLHGSGNPNGSSATGWFEYGTTTSLGYTSASRSLGSSTSETDYSVSISGLSHGRTYHYRAVVQNSYGMDRGSILSFTTDDEQDSGDAPLVDTKSASNISDSSATLRGSVNPNDSYTTAWFEYGTSRSLGHTTSSFSLGSGDSYQNYSTTVFDLDSDTTHYYRAVARNDYDTVRGSLSTFTTDGEQITTDEDWSGVAYSLTQLTSALARLNVLIGGLGTSRVTERVIERVEVASYAGSDLAKLTFTADKTSLDPGDKIVFTIQVEPLTNLTNAVLVVKLDSSFEFESTSVSSYSKSDNVFTYNLGSISAGNTQIFKINAHLSSDFDKSDAENGTITSTAVFSYADANGNAKTPLFSSLNTQAGGAGFFAGLFAALPGGPIVTILLIALLILIVAIAIRKLLS